MLDLPDWLYCNVYKQKGQGSQGVSYLGVLFDLKSSGFARLSVELDELVLEVFDPIGCSYDGTITAVAGGRC